MAFCPSLTAIYSSELNGRCAGFITGVGNDLEADNVVRIADFEDTEQAYTMIDIYKSDGSNVYQNSMIWAESYTIALNGPLANSSGVAYMGYFPLGSILQSNGST
jgi:hypothetical protein